jgi:thiamine biosynthesis lipoprotein
VATSGSSERGIVVDGERLGHILDPRTGRPSGDFGSVTVWAPDAFTADCLSTALYVMGPDAALAWAATHPGQSVVVVRQEDGTLTATATPDLRDRLVTVAEEVVLNWIEFETDGIKTSARNGVANGEQESAQATMDRDHRSGRAGLHDPATGDRR